VLTDGLLVAEQVMQTQHASVAPQELAFRARQVHTLRRLAGRPPPQQLPIAGTFAHPETARRLKMAYLSN
jgi:hypothetical protein